MPPAAKPPPRPPKDLNLSCCGKSNAIPRLAVAAATIIAVSVLSDFVSSGPSLTESAVQLSNQYFADN
jgi:hypothetical protein